MKAEALGQTVVRIELLHAALVVLLAVALVPMKWVYPGSLVAGALFMGVNFLLLSSGIRWVLTPFAGKGRVRSGVALLIVKMALFLGAMLLLLTRVSLDPLSFTLGFSSLLAAILAERLWALSR
ncbi:MAG TPA: hypothetical protein VHL99_00295 [Candidatus Binatia bacterium]|nr:hypothetical protein [Candidatus Binatia bacterium]